MTMNDPILEVLREIRGDLGRVTTELGQLVRRVDYTNARLDEQGEQQREHGKILREHTEILRGHTARLESVERNTAATIVAIDVLNAGVRAIGPALEQVRLVDDRLGARVDDCERRIHALEQR